MKRYCSYASLLPLIAATPAFAQTITDPANAYPPDETIIVSASRIPLEPREIGSAFSVLSSHDIAREQTTFVKDILQDVPGVQITTDRPGDQTSVSIRGSDNDQVLWLIDGIKLGDPSLISTQFQSDHLTTSDVARIEVLRGNQSSLYGSDAIGGVINVITQRATEEGLRLNAEGETGSYGTMNGGASVLGKYGALDFRLTATGYSHDGPSLADANTASDANPVTEDDGYWRYGFSGRAGIAATDTLSFQMIGFWQDSDFDLDNTDSDSSDTVRKREYAMAGQTRYLSADSRLSADASVSRYVTRRLYYGTYYSPEGDLYKGYKDAANFNLGYNGGVWSIAAGTNWEEEKTNQVTAFGGAFREKIETKSAYGELALRPVENLTVTGAARIDDNSRFGSFDTYRATIAYVLPGLMGADSFKVRASYGTGAKAPGLYQLFDPAYGNPDLDVETSKGGDVGFDLDFKWMSAQVSYFFAKTRNEIVWDYSVGLYGGYAQYGRTRKDGVELAFEVNPADWISIRQSFTFLTAEQDEDRDGIYLDMGRPKRSGATSVTFTPTEQISIGARAHYRSRNASSYGGATDAYEVFDLLGSYRISEKVEIYGRITNLFDSDYQMAYGKNALGRAAYGGVRYSF